MLRNYNIVHKDVEIKKQFPKLTERTNRERADSFG